MRAAKSYERKAQALKKNALLSEFFAAAKICASLLSHNFCSQCNKTIEMLNRLLEATSWQAPAWREQEDDFFFIGKFAVTLQPTK
jgi:hypothetical protein